MYSVPIACCHRLATSHVGKTYACDLGDLLPVTVGNIYFFSYGKVMCIINIRSRPGAFTLLNKKQPHMFICWYRKEPWSLPQSGNLDLVMWLDSVGMKGSLQLNCQHECSWNWGSTSRIHSNFLMVLSILNIALCYPVCVYLIAVSSSDVCFSFSLLVFFVGEGGSCTVSTSIFWLSYDRFSGSSWALLTSKS